MRIYLNEMGMRPIKHISHVRVITNWLENIQSEMIKNFKKRGVYETLKYRVFPNESLICTIKFVKPLIDKSGQDYTDKAEQYLKGEAIDLANIPADAATLSVLASIASDIEYDNATFINDHEVELVNPEIISNKSQMIKPKSIGKLSDPKIIEEKTYYGIFSKSGYESSDSDILKNIKRRILKDCIKRISDSSQKIYRNDGSIFGIFNTKEEAAEVKRCQIEDHIESSPFRNSYKPIFAIAKCNKKGELIMTLKDFYDQDLWINYPNEKVIKECIKMYNESILERGAKD